MATHLTDAEMYRGKTEAEIAEIKKWREVYHLQSDDEVIRIINERGLRPAARDAAFCEVVSRDSIPGNRTVIFYSPKKTPKTKIQTLLGFLVVAFFLFRIFWAFWVNR